MPSHDRSAGAGALREPPRARGQLRRRPRARTVQVFQHTRPTEASSAAGNRVDSPPGSGGRCARGWLPSTAKQESECSPHMGLPDMPNASSARRESSSCGRPGVQAREIRGENSGEMVGTRRLRRLPRSGCLLQFRVPRLGIERDGARGAGSWDRAHSLDDPRLGWPSAVARRNVASESRFSREPHAMASSDSWRGGACGGESGHGRRPTGTDSPLSQIQEVSQKRGSRESGCREETSVASLLLLPRMRRAARGVETCAGRQLLQ